MIYKLVFQVPFDEDRWDPDVASSLRVETPGDRHGPHIKIYPDQRDAETGEPCAFIRCKHETLDDLQRLAERVLEALPTLVGMDP